MMNRSALVLVLLVFLPTLCMAEMMVLTGTQYAPGRSTDFLSEISPNYRFNNSLPLTKVRNNPRKQSFMFVFLMNKDKAKRLHRKTKDNPRSHMHLLWTGSKKLMPEQKVIENRYPVDVSIANYDDGYAAGEWNLVLPNKKPREVGISLMWTF